MAVACRDEGKEALLRPIWQERFAREVPAKVLGERRTLTDGEDAREALAPFAELVKSPEHVHTYRLTPLSIRNARSSGLSGAAMVAAAATTLA